MRELCSFCRQRHNACLAHDLHRTKAEKKRLRADLAMACTPWPGGWCPPITPRDKRIEQ